MVVPEGTKHLTLPQMAGQGDFAVGPGFEGNWICGQNFSSEIFRRV